MGSLYAENKGTTSAMEIRKLFGNQQDAVQSSSLQSGGTVASGVASGSSTSSTDETDTETGEVTQNGQDRVSLSPLSRQLSQVAQILGEDEVQRSSRIASLKQSVENGSYNVSSQDVAQSIVNFAADGASPVASA